MMEKQAMLRRIAALEFAAWELHLFLDTHPENAEAGKKLEEYKTRADALRKECEEKYGPVGELSTEASRWAWVRDPWPWDPMSAEKEEK